MLPILFNLYGECLTKEALQGFGDFKIGGQIIHTVKYVDDLVLLAEKGKVLQGMIDKLVEIGGCYGMEINVEKTKVMRILRQPSPVTIMIDQQQLENVECFKHLGSMLTNDGRCTCDIKSYCHSKSCIQQEEDSFYQHIGPKFEEETNKMLHLEHRIVWC